MRKSLRREIEEELEMCDFCCRTGRKRNLHPLPESYDEGYAKYCPDCLPQVLQSVQAIYACRVEQVKLNPAVYPVEVVQKYLE